MCSEPPDANRRFVAKYGLPFRILSDSQHLLVRALDISVSKKHPMALKYPNGFLQPAVFIFDQDGRQRFAWRQKPTLTNFFGAARRISPGDILKKVQEIARG